MNQPWGAPPAPGMPPPPPPQYRRPGPPWGVIAAIVTGVCLLVAAVVGTALFVYTTTDDADDDERAAQAGLVVAPRDLVLALQDEGSMAAVTAIGMNAIVDPAVGDTAEVRRRTDAAITDFEALDADVFRDVLAVADLDQVRRDVDSQAQRGDLPYAREIQGRYGDIIAPVLDAHGRFVATIGDPELRRDADLFELGLKQLDYVWLLSAEIPDQARWSTPEGISSMSRLLGELVSGRAAVMQLAAGSRHADAARQLDAELTAAGTSELVSQLLESGQADIQALIPAMTATNRAWQAFLGEVEATLARSG